MSCEKCEVLGCDTVHATDFHMAECCIDEVDDGYALCVDVRDTLFVETISVAFTFPITHCPWCGCDLSEEVSE